MARREEKKSAKVEAVCVILRGWKDGKREATVAALGFSTSKEKSVLVLPPVFVVDYLALAPVRGRIK